MTTESTKAGGLRVFGREMTECRREHSIAIGNFHATCMRVGNRRCEWNIWYRNSPVAITRSYEPTLIACAAAIEAELSAIADAIITAKAGL